MILLPQQNSFEVIKQLFRDEKPAEADKLANTLLSDCFTRIRTYETAGMLKISLHENEHCRDYRHELDLMRGIAKVEYTRRGTHYVRECFSSYPGNVIVYHVASDGDALKAEIGYDRENKISQKASDNELCIIARTNCGDHKFCVKIRVITDGTVSAKNGSPFVSGTNEFTVVVNIATEFRFGENFADAITFPANTHYNALHIHHEKYFLSVMSRVDIKVPEAQEMENVSMPLRLKTLSCNRHNDGGLVMMVWLFGNMQLFEYMKNYLLESGKKTAKTG